jgi:hypothetical protein
MRSGYSDVSWFFRAMRVVPVIAGAALLGGMIGGFAIYAIDSALTWEPASQPRPEARADNQASANQTSANQTNATNQQTTKPVRIVGGAIPDPSAGMSGPPPAPQQQRSSAPAPSQLSSQLLTPKPLGPASRLQSQSAIAGSPQTPIGAPQESNQQNQTVNQGTIQASAQAPVQTQNATAAPQQPTHWPDALSRAHQNAANTQQQTAPATTQASEPAAGKVSTDRAATAANVDDQDRAASRRDRHSKRHTIVGTNGLRTGTEDDASAAPSRRQQDARSYGRLYDSYGSRRQRSYGNAQEQSYGNAREDADDSGYGSETSRSDTRRYGRDARSRGRSRVIVREQPEEEDRGQAFEARPRSEPFWGGGFFRRGDSYGDED